MHEVQHRWSKPTSFVRSTTLFAEGNFVLCPQKRNDVFALQKMMLTASGQTMLCPADTNTKRKHFPKGSVFFLGSLNLMTRMKCA